MGKGEDSAVDYVHQQPCNHFQNLSPAEGIMSNPRGYNAVSLSQTNGTRRAARPAASAVILFPYQPIWDYSQPTRVTVPLKDEVITLDSLSDGSG